jgi:hypothetical protein
VVGLSYAPNGQELELGAYAALPKNLNTIAVAYGFSRGNVLTDPSLPISDFKISLQSLTGVYLRTRSSQQIGSYAGNHSLYPNVWKVAAQWSSYDRRAKMVLAMQEFDWGSISPVQALTTNRSDYNAVHGLPHVF